MKTHIRSHVVHVVITLALLLPFAVSRAQNVEEIFDFPMEPVHKGPLGMGSWEVFSNSKNVGAAIQKSHLEPEVHYLMLTNRLGSHSEAEEGWTFVGVSHAEAPDGDLEWKVELRATSIAPRNPTIWNPRRFTPMAGLVLAATSPEIRSEGEGLLLALAPGRTLVLFRYSGGLYGAREPLAESFDLLDSETASNAMTLRVVWNREQDRWTISGENRGGPEFLPEKASALTVLMEVSASFPWQDGTWWSGFYFQSRSSGQMMARSFRLTPSP